jgi:hypothetical protein
VQKRLEVNEYWKSPARHKVLIVAVAGVEQIKKAEQTAHAPIEFSDLYLIFTVGMSGILDPPIRGTLKRVEWFLMQWRSGFVKPFK